MTGAAEAIDKLIGPAIREQRQATANALRAIRRIDKPFARIALQRWRNRETIEDVMAMVMSTGQAMVLITPEWAKLATDPSRSAQQPTWKRTTP